MYNIKIELKTLIVSLVSSIIFFIGTLGLAVFIQGNTDVFLWNKEARITIVIVNGIQLLFNFCVFSFISIELKEIYREELIQEVNELLKK